MKKPVPVVISGAQRSSKMRRRIAGSILVLCSAVSVSVQAKQVQTPPPRVRFESGVLYWQSTEKFREIVHPSEPVSQLTFENMNSRSVELFTRLDINRLFAKASIGIGSISSGQQYDEDWFDRGKSYSSYSKTLSQISGITNSMVADIGLTVFQKEGERIALFLGFGYYNQKTDLLGCFQLVELFRTCLEASDSRLVRTTSVIWKSLRVGATAERRMSKRFQIGGEIVPMYSNLSGRDNHLLRDFTTWFNLRGNGYGLQVEATAKYLVNDNFSIGGGWRYWMSEMWGGGNCTSNGYNGCYDGSVRRAITPYSAQNFSAEHNGFIVQFTGRF